MKPGPWFAKIAAVVSALALLVVYVYDRAGGTLLPNWGESKREPSTSDRIDAFSEVPQVQDRDAFLMYSSKSGTVMPPRSKINSDNTPSTANENQPTYLPGLKSAVVFPTPAGEQSPDSPELVNDIAHDPFEPDDSDHKRQRRVLLPGPKAPAAPVFNVNSRNESSPSGQPGSKR